MWIERRHGRCLARFADAAAPRAQRRCHGIRSPEQACFVVAQRLCVSIERAFPEMPATAACRRRAFYTSGAPPLLNEKAKTLHGCSVWGASSLTSSPRRRGSSTPQPFHGASLCNRRDPIFSPKACICWIPAFAGMTGGGVAIVPTPISSQRSGAIQVSKRSARGSELPGYARSDAMLCLHWLSTKRPSRATGVRRDALGSGKVRGYCARSRPAFAGRPAA
jgi:hypothetical protein